MKNQEKLRDMVIYPFMKAWSYFYEIPFPFFPELRSNLNTADIDKKLVIYNIPILGCVTGLIAYIFVVVMFSICGNVVTAIVAPIVLIIIWEILNSGKDTYSLTALIAKKTFQTLGSDLKVDSSLKTGDFVFLYIFIAIFIVRLLALGFLIYYDLFSWIITIPIFSLTLQAYLASGYGKDAKRAFLSTDKQTITMLWVIAGLACVVCAGIHLLALVITYLFVILLGMQIKNFLNQRNLLTNETIGIAGKLAELIVVILGIVIVFHL